MIGYILCGVGAVALAKYMNIPNKCVEKYHKFRKLNNLVSMEYDGWEIYWVSSKIVAKSMYLDLCQTLNQSVRKIGKNKFEVTYILNEQEYKFIIEGRRGPKNILAVRDENDNDVTEKMMPYLGPKQNWHGRKFTPNNFGHERLTFELVGGQQLSFEKLEWMDMGKIPELFMYS
jgi:hypothetical protein